MKSQETPNRRNFLTQVLAGWFFIVLVPAIYAIVEYIIPPRLREKVIRYFLIGKVSDLALESAEIVRADKKAFALVRTQEGQIRAFSAVCTHLGCVVQYQSDRKVFHCNCHGSEYNLDGKNIAGPAPKPLLPFKAEVKGDDIFISQI